MQDMLKDQVAIVTGGTSGMGESTARLFAKEGAKVVVAGRSEKKAQKICDEIIAEGGIAMPYGGLDVSDKDAVDASMLICQMAQYYRAKGMNLADALRNLLRGHGCFSFRDQDQGMDG